MVTDTVYEHLVKVQWNKSRAVCVNLITETLSSLIKSQDMSRRCETQGIAYRQFRGELSTVEGIWFKGARMMMIPKVV